MPKHTPVTRNAPPVACGPAGPCVVTNPVPDLWWGARKCDLAILEVLV